MEKIVTINYSVLIGYAALVAAIAGIASHNTLKDPKLKKEFISFLYTTVMNVLINLANLLISFLLTFNDVNFICRLLIGVSISSIVALSHAFVKLINKLIY